MRRLHISLWIPAAIESTPGHYEKSGRLIDRPCEMFAPRLLNPSRKYTMGISIVADPIPSRYKTTEDVM